MPLHGISHITYIVKDLERMATFLCEGLDAVEVYDSRDKNFSLSREKFFTLGGVWLAAMQGDAQTERTYQHLAFKLEAHELLHYQTKLLAIGVEFKPPRARVQGEGQSLYFYDFDNHLFELHTDTLEIRLAQYQI